MTNAQTGSKIAKLQEKGMFYAKQIEIEAKKLVSSFSFTFSIRILLNIIDYYGNMLVYIDICIYRLVIECLRY